jgi:hypothetical protein
VAQPDLVPLRAFYSSDLRITTHEGLPA